MKLFKFEIKKIWKQKKLLWLALIVILFMSFQYYQNIMHQDSMVDRLYESTEPLSSSVNQIDSELNEKSLNSDLDEMAQEQFVFIKDMKAALQQWRSAIHLEEFHNLPHLESTFLESLQNYLRVGGEFDVLNGLSLEYAINKNEWMIYHDLSVEDEEYPLSSHLFLSEASDWLLGILGVIILLLMFGNILSTEKEHHTWFTLKTQPIVKSKIILTKYFAILNVSILYIFLVITFGILLPALLNDSNLLFNYPHLLYSNDGVHVISTLSYLLLKIGLFIGAVFISFSLLFFISILFKQVFSTFIVTFFVLLIGYYSTTFFQGLETPINIFQHLRASHNILEINYQDIWYYPLFAVIWSIVFLAITVFIPERYIQSANGTNTKKAFNSGKTKQRGPHLDTIVFELRKLLRKGNFIKVLSVLLLLMVFGYFYLHQMAAEKEVAYFDQLKVEESGIEEEMIPMYEERLSEFVETSQNTKDEGEQNYLKQYIEGSNQAIALYQDRAEKINAGIEGYQQGDWDSFYEQQLFKIKLVNGDFDDSLHFIEHNFDHRFQYKVSVEEKSWLMEHNIQPIFPGEFRVTMHDEWTDDPQGEINRDGWEAQNKKVDSSGLYSLFHFYEFYVYIIPLILFLFLLGSGFASERHKKNTINILQTQPISKKNIFLGKTISSLFIVVVSFLALIILLILIGTIFNRFGDWYYPVLHYDSLSLSSATGYTGILTDYNNYGFHFIPLGNYLTQCLVLLIMLSIFVITLANFISIFIKNTFLVFVLSISTLIGGYFVSLEFSSNWSYLSPFIYLDILKISNGEMATLLDQSLINVYVGSSILLVCSSLFIFIGYVKLKWFES